MPLDERILKEILDRNPDLDAEKILSGLKFRRKLQKQGVGKGYGLATPAERHRVTVGRGMSPDPRGVKARVVR